MFIASDAATMKWPFIGLRPFDYPDRAFFFGRGESIDVVEALVRRPGFVAVVGSSGTGKSSLIRAGLLPKLETRAEEAWRWATMEPGGAPIRRLARAIASLRGIHDDLDDAWNERIELCLRGSKFGIPQAISLFPEPLRAGRFIVIVDQFEELFRFANLRAEIDSASAAASHHRDEATAFVRLLLSADSVAAIPVHIVITMRSDFIGDCAHFHGLPEAVTRRQFLVPGLTRDQRAMAIELPVQKAKAKIDPELVQRLLNDTNEDPDQLPIIQHVMMRCWHSAIARAQDDAVQLEVDDYFKVGGVANALSQHANEIFEEFSRFDASEKPKVSRQLIAKRVFQALTEVDEDGRVVRRPMMFGELQKYVSSSDWDEKETRDAVVAVAQRLAAADCSFLRTKASGDLDDKSIVDIGHEALIRRWSKLKGGGETDWIREEQDDGEKYRDLVRVARAKGVIAGPELPSYEKWWAGRKPTAVWAKRYTKGGQDYMAEVGEALARSRREIEDDEREREAAARAEREAREAQLKLAAASAQAEAASARAAAAEHQAKASAAEVAIHRQRSRMRMVGALVAVTAAAVGILFYLTREQIAEQKQQQQKLIMLAAENILKPKSLAGAADALSLLTASPTSDWDKDYVRQINSTLNSLREVRRITSLEPYGSSGDGKIAAGSAAAKTGINSVSVNPNQDIPLLLAVSGTPPVLHFLTFAEGGRTVRWLGKMPAPELAGGWVRANWSPDGRRIYLGGGGATAIVLTPCSLLEVRRYLGQRCEGKTTDEVQKIGDGVHPVGYGAWTADGKDIVTNPRQGQPSVWNTETGKIDEARIDDIPMMRAQGKSLTCLAVSPSGDTVAEGDTTGSIIVVSTTSKTGTGLGPQPGFIPSQIYFNPVNEDQIVAISQNRTVVWQKGMPEPEPLSHSNATAMQAAFDSKGRFLVTGANDGMVRLWKLNPHERVATRDPTELRGHHGPVFTVDVGPDGTIVSGSGDGSLRFWRTDAPNVSEQQPDLLKRLVASNLPYLDYGDKRLAASATACSIMGNCPSASEE